jgi:hypothetical protein
LPMIHSFLQLLILFGNSHFKTLELVKVGAHD